MASADENQTQRERRERRHVDWSGIIGHNRNQQLLDLLLLAPSIRQAETHDCTNAHRGVLFVDALVKQTIRWIAVVSYVDIDETDGKQTASHNLLLHAVEVVVYSGKTVFYVPE